MAPPNAIITGGYVATHTEGAMDIMLVPPGTNPNPYDGRCVRSGGVRCPRGYNALGGRCVPN